MNDTTQTKPEIVTETFYFGIHDKERNFSTFQVIKETDNENYTDFEVCRKSGINFDDDLDVITEIAIDLTCNGSEKEFDSCKDNKTYFIVKIDDEIHSSFLK